MGIAVYFLQALVSTVYYYFHIGSYMGITLLEYFKVMLPAIGDMCAYYPLTFLVHHQLAFYGVPFLLA